MSFELKQLGEAAEKYSHDDAGTHGACPCLAIYVNATGMRNLIQIH